MKEVIILIKSELPRDFTRKQFITMMLTRSKTSHPLHLLQHLTEKGKLHHVGSSRYRIA